MVDAMQFLKQFFKRVRQVPAGFKTVYAETKEVRALSRKKASLSLKNLSRREEELIRYNRLCLSKIAVFLAAQVPPIIGYLPLFVYFSYPRQLLTRHFWSEEERASFPVEEYKERRMHARTLLSFVNTQKLSSVSLVQSVSSLDSLPKAHLTSLAGANGICSSQTILKLAPGFFLKRWMESRAREILLDDTLLELEGVEGLDPDELQIACLRRGLNPCITSLGKEELKKSLGQWTVSPISKYCRSVKPIPTSLLLHATALPELFANDKDIEKLVKRQ